MHGPAEVLNFETSPEALRALAGRWGVGKAAGFSAESRGSLGGGFISPTCQRLPCGANGLRRPFLPLRRICLSQLSGGRFTRSSASVTGILGK